MSAINKIKTPAADFKNLLSAVKKLSAEEKQLLRLQLFATDAVSEMKAFEAQLKKRKPLVKKTDAEIVRITTSIRKEKNVNTKKVLY